MSTTTRPRSIDDATPAEWNAASAAHYARVNAPPADWQAASPAVQAQPAPTPTAGPAIWPLVVADMCERDRVGRERYGVPLQPGNGRDALVDAYQEALDLACYLRQAIYERDAGRPGVDPCAPFFGRFNK